MMKFPEVVRPGKLPNTGGEQPSPNQLPKTGESQTTFAAHRSDDDSW